MNAYVCRPRAWFARLAVVVFVCLVGQTLFAATVVVGTCKNLVTFTSIQAAVNAVPSGSTIDICPGTYNEQISINKSVTLTGVAVNTSDAVVILPPAAGLGPNATSLATGNPIAAEIWVLGPATVNMNNLIVDSIGNGQSGCGQPTLVGILYQNASGTLNHVATRNQWIGGSESDNGSNGCQTGLGIFVQSGNSGTSTVNVMNSSVHDYQKNGITGNEVGTTLNVTGSDIVGQGATNGAAENGIQIGFGAAGTVTGNMVIDDVWAPDTITDAGDAAAGILLYDTAVSKATVKNNTVGNTQFGIALVTDTSGEGDGASVTLNKVFGTRIFDAIDVCTNSNIIQSNTIMNSSESAIHLDASCGVLDGGTSGSGNAVTSNTIVDACTGILQDSGTSNTTTPNTYFAAGTTTGSSCTPTPTRQLSTGSKAGNTRNTTNRVPYRPARP
jgi:nitrous oxidase accessory protein NosD